MQEPKGTRLMFKLPAVNTSGDRTQVFGERMTRMLTSGRAAKPAPDRIPATEPAEPIYVGRIIREKRDTYQIGEKIGEGGLAYVYKGTRIEDDEEVAIKILKPLPKDELFDHKLRERFAKEGFFLTQFDHPNILKCYGVIEQDDTVYLVIELLKGDVLTNVLKEVKLSIQDAVAIALMILDGLEEVHFAGIVHRDLKPDNVFICEGGSLKIIDFGVSRIEGGAGFGLTAKGTTLGTPEYIAPEQISDSNVDVRADLYSLGIMFYEMLAGTVPFTSDKRDEQERMMEIIMKHLDGKPKPIRSTNPRVSEQLEKLVFKLMAKGKDERYATAVEVKTELERLRNEGLLEGSQNRQRGLLDRLFGGGRE